MGATVRAAGSHTFATDVLDGAGSSAGDGEQGKNQGSPEGAIYAGARPHTGADQEAGMEQETAELCEHAGWRRTGCDAAADRVVWNGSRRFGANVGNVPQNVRTTRRRRRSVVQVAARTARRGVWDLRILGGGTTCAGS